MKNPAEYRRDGLGLLHGLSLEKCFCFFENFQAVPCDGRKDFAVTKLKANARTIGCSYEPVNREKGVPIPVFFWHREQGRRPEIQQPKSEAFGRNPRLLTSREGEASCTRKANSFFIENETNGFCVGVVVLGERAILG
ncbi:MAG: hypothetical protein LiPW30_464 [Parcubacteria group bacterium LiPW_30]|nr:MAG: hypothetical protein LiPW30_464 [Parcubacteria group bacterium LiPW_30]